MAILNNSEKQYLQTVIEPFIDKVCFIVKVKAATKGTCKLKIKVSNDLGDVILYKFNEDEEYVGMELDVPYGLKELGLIKEGTVSHTHSITPKLEIITKNLSNLGISSIGKSPITGETILTPKFYPPASEVFNFKAIVPDTTEDLETLPKVLDKIGIKADAYFIEMTMRPGIDVFCLDTRRVMLFTEARAKGYNIYPVSDFKKYL